MNETQPKNETFEVGLSQASLNTRHLGIGASEVAAILGLSKWANARDIYEGKINPQRKPLPSGIKKGAPMFWGNILEQTVGETWSELNQVDVELYDKAKHGVFEIGHVRATPDFLVCDSGAPLEIKTTGAYTPNWAGVIPTHYKVQLLVQMACMDSEIGYLACLKGGNDFSQYEIRRDRELEATIFAECERFWEENVERQIPPSIPPVEPDSVQYTLKPSVKSCDCPEELWEELSWMVDLENKRDVLDDEIKRIKFKVREEMADVEALINGVTGQKLVSFKAALGRKTTDWRALAMSLAEEHGVENEALNEAITRHTKRGESFRRLTISRKAVVEARG